MPLGRKTAFYLISYVIKADARRPPPAGLLLNPSIWGMCCLLLDIAVRVRNQLERGVLLELRLNIQVQRYTAIQTISEVENWEAAVAQQAKRNAESHTHVAVWSINART
jgi:hypothetical protein